MGAISSEIVHLLKVKLSLQNDQRDPLPDQKVSDLFFNRTLLNTSL